MKKIVKNEINKLGQGVWNWNKGCTSKTNTWASKFKANCNLPSGEGVCKKIKGDGHEFGLGPMVMSPIRTVHLIQHVMEVSQQAKSKARGNSKPIWILVKAKNTRQSKLPALANAHLKAVVDHRARGRLQWRWQTETWIEHTVLAVATSWAQTYDQNH